MPHMQSAYNLARWLVRNDHDAEDMVQEAYLRAFKFFDSFRGGGDARAWLLSIVRNTCYTWLKQNRVQDLITSFDEEVHEHSAALEATSSISTTNPETLLLQQVDEQTLRQALEALPVEFREVMILRELEDMSYKQIAAITDVPVGTVMSRLARARKRLQECLTVGAKEGVSL
ncbi:MAG: sigma-70 family RNA polymerase sigma factor [Gammaproteobacteria bacterium]|nr:sigma-70 family RNA polymerase sigma factor [Gammaproteobacteria bacterium]